MKPSITTFVTLASTVLLIAGNVNTPLYFDHLQAQTSRPMMVPKEPVEPPPDPGSPRPKPPSPAPPLSMPPQAPGSLGVLALNMNGDNSPKGTSWEARVDRIAAWMQRHNVVPDVIVLQELYGFSTGRYCGGLFQGVGDYDQLDRLLHELATATGVVYRVAYMTGTPPGSIGDWPFTCTVYHAQSMLYNPQRLVNLTAREPSSNAVKHDEGASVYSRVHQRRSLPLCHRGTRLMPLEQLIDGPPQRDKCGRETPSGPAWAVFREGAHIAGSFVRFAFVSDLNRAIDIFNVHPGSGDVQRDKPLIQSLIALMGAPPYARLPLYYPPILAGDFNDLPAAELGNFVELTNPPHEPEDIAIQKGDTIPSQFRVRSAEWLLLPDLTAGETCEKGGPSAKNVSDHCGVFVRFEHDGADAGELRQVFLKGPSKVITGERYRLEAVPSGGSNNLRYDWHPWSSTNSHVEAAAGAPGTGEAWTVYVTDLQTGIRKGAQMQVIFTPDNRCQIGCAKRRDACMACQGPGCPLRRECVAEYQLCVQACPY